MAAAVVAAIMDSAAGANASAAARILSKHAEYVLGLSATPVYNYGDEIYNVLESLSPGCLGEWQEFSREWLGWDGRKVKDPKALGSFLREKYLMVRRTRAEFDAAWGCYTVYGLGGDRPRQ